MIICSYCAAEMPEVSAFCPGCGRPVDEPQEARPEVRAGSRRDAVLAATAYLTPLPAALFLYLPQLRQNRFVRFHSWQSLFLAAGAIVGSLVIKLVFMLLSFLPFIGFLLAWLSVGIALIAVLTLWAALVTKAALGDSYVLPGVGDWAVRLSN